MIMTVLAVILQEILVQIILNHVLQTVFCLLMGIMIHFLSGMFRMLKQVRTDVRVANLSYIQAGWYIEMMRQKAFDSDPLPLTLGPEKYIEGVREQLPVNNRVDKPVESERGCSVCRS